jgi:hypothetical protein
MLRVIRSAASEQDVYEIALFIARDNPDAAIRLIDLTKHCRCLHRIHWPVVLGKNSRPRREVSQWETIFCFTAGQRTGLS